MVRKSSPMVHRPASDPEPATLRCTIKLSSFDKGLYKVSATTLLVFEDPMPNAAEAIPDALSRALVHYYPFADQIVAGDDDDDGDVYIKCSGEGVAFVAVSTDHAVKEVICLDQSSPGARMLADELAVYIDGQRASPARHSTGPCQHGPVANGPAWHAMPHRAMSLAFGPGMAL
ncbi:acyl transferase 15-like [Miscanthus floridulus]|uniref:acyl transferase 15-like n=1 Tax=Miscanthus floridulus TaxID=154761 RepID=UPI003458892E